MCDTRYISHTSRALLSVGWMSCWFCGFGGHDGIECGCGCAWSIVWDGACTTEPDHDDVTVTVAVTVAVAVAVAVAVSVTVSLTVAGCSCSCACSLCLLCLLSLLSLLCVVVVLCCVCVCTSMTRAIERLTLLFVSTEQHNVCAREDHNITYTSHHITSHHITSHDIT